MSSLDTTESFRKEKNVANEKSSTGGGDNPNSNELEAQHRGLVSQVTMSPSINLSVEI